LETVKAAEFFLADGVILTGNATGEEVSVRDLSGIFFFPCVSYNVIRFQRRHIFLGANN